MEAVQLEDSVAELLDSAAYPVGSVAAHHEQLHPIECVLLGPLQARALPERYGVVSMRVHSLANQFVAVFGYATPPPVGYAALDLIVLLLFALKVYPHPSASV